METPPDDGDGPHDGAVRSTVARDLLQRGGAWFQATPAELVGLVVLLAGALAVTAVVYVDASRRPAELLPAATVGTPAEHDAHADGSIDRAPGPDRVSEDPPSVTVHVSGAVTSAGIVTLVAGARVADAIAAAGGSAPDAHLDGLNLARILLDGEQVHVPQPGDDPRDVVVPDGGVAPDGRIDLNRATEETLQTLPGIGPSKAAAIVTHRDAEGPFAVPGDLRAVPGIGERTFQQLADLITVG